MTLDGMLLYFVSIENVDVSISLEVFISTSLHSRGVSSANNLPR